MPASLGAVLVSILICSRDRADSLKATLESLGQVSFCGHTVEVVLVDNGSSDHTREVIAGWVPGEVTKQAVFFPGAGKAAALNEAVARSRGEILVFTDDDVRFEAGWLE